MILDKHGRPLEKVRNADQSKPENAMLRQQLQKLQARRVNESVAKFRKALQRAEDNRNPQRNDLHRLYRDLLLDAHISAQMETRKNNIKRKDFRIVNQEDEELEELTRIFKDDWFRKFLDFSMNSIFWGFSVIELGEVVEDRFTDIAEVPRDHIIPEKMQAKVRPYDREGFDITEDPYKDWTIFVGSRTDFGLLLKLSPVGLWKKSSFGAWADYNEIFGMPLAVGYTKAGDEETKDDFEHALSNLHDYHYAIFNEDQDRIEITQPTVGSSRTFENIIKQTNEEISKLILGQTQSADTSSSRAQAEVHERVMHAYEEADMHLTATAVNKELIPRMQRFGILPEGVSFAYNTSETFGLEKRWEVAKAVLQTPGYRIPAEVLEQDFGVRAEEVGTPQPSGQEEGGGGPPRGMMAKNALVQDYPQEAVDNAAEAMKFTNSPEGRGRGNLNARRIAKKLMRHEPIGANTLQDIRTYAVNRTHKDRPWTESEASLNFALVGGTPMVDDYAKRKLEEIRNWIQEASQTMKDVEQLYDAGGGDKGPA